MVLAPYQGDQNAIAAFEAAAIEEGLDPESEDFADEAADAGIIATYVDEDGETQEVDADTYAEEVEGSEPDPTEYGMWVPGIPVLVEQGLDSIGCADWLKALDPRWHCCWRWRGTRLRSPDAGTVLAARLPRVLRLYGPYCIHP